MPEQQSATHPFIKPKWDERAYFLVQDSILEAMDDGCAASGAQHEHTAAHRTGGVHVQIGRCTCPNRVGPRAVLRMVDGAGFGACGECALHAA